MAEKLTLIEIEEIAIAYFEAKYPLLNLKTNPFDREEIDWIDMLSFASHILDNHRKIN